MRKTGEVLDPWPSSLPSISTPLTHPSSLIQYITHVGDSLFLGRAPKLCASKSPHYSSLPDIHHTFAFCIICLSLYTVNSIRAGMFSSIITLYHFQHGLWTLSKHLLNEWTNEQKMNNEIRPMLPVTIPILIKRQYSRGQVLISDKTVQIWPPLTSYITYASVSLSVEYDCEISHLTGLL